MAQIGSTNGASGGAAPPADAPGYQLIVNTQYLKDLSFESPRAPQTLMSQRETPEVNLTADVKARSLGPDVYEVVLTMGANARHKEDPVFVVELSYAAVVTVKDAPAELVPLLVFVETPRLLFPCGDRGGHSQRRLSAAPGQSHRLRRSAPARARARA
jgi:preprotein translocase subunit SecB